MKKQLNHHYSHKGTFTIDGFYNIGTKLWYSPSERWNGYRCPAVAVEDLPIFVAKFNEASQRWGLQRPFFVLRGSTLYFYDTDGERYELAPQIGKPGEDLKGYDVSCGLAWDLVK